MTTHQPDHQLALRQASAAVGLDATGARLIHHYSNAIYLLPVPNVVARVTYGHDAAERVGRSQAIIRWLTRQRRFPATQPLGDAGPITVNGAAVSFWVFYPQPDKPPSFTSGHLAALLRLLHQAGTPPVSLPSWVPLESLHAVVEDRVLSAALTDEERAWVMSRIAEVRDEIADLDWPLGTGLIHGDAWAGNLLSCPGARPAEVVLGDWDWVCSGPREVDLIPTWHAAARYGKPESWVTEFTRAYGYDLGRWDGYRVLMGMRDLVQLTGPIRRARDSGPHRLALRQRLDDLRAGDITSTWKAL